MTIENTTFLTSAHRRPVVSALLASEQVIHSQSRPKIQFPSPATSTKTVLPLLFPTPLAVPGASLTAPKTIHYA